MLPVRCLGMQKKGNVQLDIMIATLIALDLTQHINLFLPKHEISFLQLTKLHERKEESLR